MKQFFPILVLVCSAWPQAWGQPRNRASQQPQSSSSSQSSPQAVSPAPAISTDQENANKAKAVVEQGIQALGGQAYLTIRDREQQGRGYSFHHGRESGGGAFLGFTQCPDKEAAA